MKSILLLIASHLLLNAEPTELRQWQTHSGHQTQARALSATTKVVKLELSSGKTVDIELDKLIPADRELILKHFKIGESKEGNLVHSIDSLIRAEGQPHPPGKISGPVESAEGSHYYIYIPKSLREGRKAPLLHFNGSGGGNPEQMKRYLAGCDRFNWILVASVESSNKNFGQANLRHAANNIRALRTNPLVDPQRIYFTGQSGGGAMSWWNARALDGAGTLPVIGYIPEEIKINKGHHFVLGGATDWNRYLGGRAAAEFGNNAFYRMYPGGHSFPKDDRIIHEGIGWLTGKYLEAKKSVTSLANERLDYEAAMIEWIQELAPNEPWLALHLGIFMEKTYKISGKNADILGTILSTLRQRPENIAFADGVKAIHDFGVKEFSNFRYIGTMNGKNNEAHAKSITRLAARYKGIPFVEETLLEMAKPCQK